MARNEVAQMIRNGRAFDIAAGLNFSGDPVGDIVRPMLKRIEGDNADWVVELPSQKIGDPMAQLQGTRSTRHHR
jgi:hypothetical protein